MESLVRNLEVSLRTGFIDKRLEKQGRYKPQLLVNDVKTSENVLNTLLEELERCQSFLFSVAFITESGLATLKSHFLDLRAKGVKGRILTSTFLQFNKPKIFRELLKIENVEVRLTDVKGFHAKGYIFHHEDHASLIVGSSNLTAHALKVNYEWNVKLTSHEKGELIYHFNNQFEEVWEGASVLTEEWIAAYENIYIQQPQQAFGHVIESMPQYPANPLADALRITPNKMQEAALAQIAALRAEGKDKGLIISATGTGKTYLAAFDVRRYQPKRMLFLVHREQIAKKAKDDFQKIFGGRDEDFGIVSGSHKQTDAKYVFATIQTMTKDRALQTFAPDAFDYILIDEVHKAGAETYQKVIEHFTPQFFMGMTATPERTDDFNIYGLFDYNIAYEIRLQEALEEDMLCPFHYFGVTDVEYDGQLIDDTTVTQKLVMKERVDHIIEKINYYGFSGEQVRGLMFCSRKEEAKDLSAQLNARGYRTVALTGEHSQEERERRVRELESGWLDYILTVEIFNEGVDIPSINQVVMLRQTQSSIIFIQQLGRGLRKHESKDYVTIIDFIGNYKNNYLIPMALSGDRSQNKDNIRRYTKDTSYIKGISTINFEEIAKKQIFQSIAHSNLTTLKILREAYVALKHKTGTIPFLYDFVKHHSIDPVVIAQACENYAQFLMKMKEEMPRVSDYENKVLTMLSAEVLHGKRKHEAVLLDLLLQEGKVTYDTFLTKLHALRCVTNERTMASVQRVLQLSFFKAANQKKYGDIPIVLFRDDGTIVLHDTLQAALRMNPYFHKLVVDIVQCAQERSRRYDSERSLTLYEKYTRKDACKLLNWDSDDSATMYGYQTKHQTCPIFVTYHKKEEIDASTNYADAFISPDVLQWSTRSNRTLQSEEVQAILRSQERGIDLHVFVKKDDSEGSDFYYIGTAIPDQNNVTQTSMKDKHDKEIPVVHMNLILEQPVSYKLYQYIQS